MLKRYGSILIIFIMVLGCISILFSKHAQSEESHNATFLKAIYAKDFPMMDKLIAGGVDINAPIRNDLTPLAEAAYAGDLEVVDYLVRKGAKVEGSKKLPNSPIYFAIFKGNTTVVSRFLDLGISPNYTWPAGEGTGGTLLTVAVDSGHLKTVELLVQRGADVNFRGSGNFGPLYRSIFSDHFDIFKFLLSKGACLDKHDKAALSGWEKNTQSDKYRELLKKNKGCIDKPQPPQ